MSFLLKVCNEVLQQILEEVHVNDLGRLRRTCRCLNEYISHNRLLFREVYLNTFDNPCRIAGYVEPDWEVALLNVVQLEELLASDDGEAKEAHFHETTRRILYLLRTAAKEPRSSHNIAFLSKLFESQQNIDTFLCRSSLFAGGGSITQIPADDEEHRQLSAMLHCLYGVPIDPSGRRENPTHPYARSRVYDLRNYNDNTIWGPFRKDGSMRVDWEMVEAIMVDIGYNMRILAERHNGICFKGMFDEPFWGVSRDSFVSPRPRSGPANSSLNEEHSPSLIDQDPYNISGTWMRVVCFLDYNDLFTFNFTPDTITDDQPREPLHDVEATRLILLTLEVTEIMPLAEGQELPTVHFEGISRSLQSAMDPNANSRIKGFVRLNKEGLPHWTTISVFYGGEERWRSEGVQPGGVNSGRGIIGTWFDKDYDVHGPAGPTAFWKLSDTQVIEKPVMSHHAHLGRAGL